MVSAQALYSPRSDGRQNCRTANQPYQYLNDRRNYPVSLAQHNSRVLTMADQGDGDSSGQRKRISVACGRCRRRKIRCSGDPGNGHPCTNCKNAGCEPCQFLRVQSHETAIKYENFPEYTYNVQEAKARNSLVSTTMAYTHELPHAGSTEMLSGGQYRSGSTYGYAKPHASYYSAMPAGYPMGYVDDYADYPTMGHHSSQHVMGQDMVPYSTWTGRDYGYGATTSLVHRPAPSVTSESANFSFHNMAAQLPASSVSVSDRLLPAPSSRSMSYAGPPSHSYRALPPAGGAVDPSPVNAAAVLADMASGTYGSSFDGLPYSGSAAAVSLQATHAGGGSDHHSSRSTNSEPYSPDSESIFTEHDHQNLRSQGSAVDLNAYTYGSTDTGSSSLRRGSAASGCPTSVSNSSGSGTTTSTSSSGRSKGSRSASSSQGGMAHGHHSQQQHHHQQIYMPATGGGGSIHDSTSSSLHHNPHHIHHGLPLATAATCGAAASGSPASAQAYLAESNNSSSNLSGTGSGHHHHTEGRRATVGSRR